MGIELCRRCLRRRCGRLEQNYGRDLHCQPRRSYSLVEFTIVHAAIYNAVQAIEGEFEPYHKVPFCSLLLKIDEQNR